MRSYLGEDSLESPFPYNNTLQASLEDLERLTTDFEQSNIAFWQLLNKIGDYTHTYDPSQQVVESKGPVSHNPNDDTLIVRIAWRINQLKEQMQGYGQEISRLQKLTGKSARELEAEQDEALQKAIEAGKITGRQVGIN